MSPHEFDKFLEVFFGAFGLVTLLAMILLLWEARKK